MNPTAHIKPRNLGIERVVLGTALMQEKACDVLVDLLTEPMFYDERHRFLFRAIVALRQRGETVDLESLPAYLFAAGWMSKVGGMTYLPEISMKAGSGAKQEQHCRKVQELWAHRLVIEAGEKLALRGYDQLADVFEILTDAQGVLNQLHQVIDKKPVSTLRTVMPEVFEQMRRGLEKNGRPGLPTGLIGLDNALGGWQPGQLTVIAARPAMGKSAVLAHIVYQAAFVGGAGVAWFTLEMPAVQQARRLVAIEVDGYSNKKLARADFPGGLDEIAAIEQKAQRLFTDRIFIDDTAGLTLEQLRAKVGRLHLETPGGLGMVAIDYLQLMEGTQGGRGAGNRNELIGGITRGLKRLAKDLNVPVILLSQLSRDVEKRGGDKRPQQADLRDSGSIEQDADNIIFLWRGEYYDITEYADGTETKDTILFDVAKQRDGNTGELVFGAKMHRSHFYDLSPLSAGEKEIGALPTSEEFSRDPLPAPAPRQPQFEQAPEEAPF